MAGKMTPEQRQICRLHVTREVAKFLRDHQERITAEIEAKYGFNPDNIEGPQHDSNTTTGNCVEDSAEDAAAPGDQKVP